MYIITEEQYRSIIETAKIRPWTDADYKKVNPAQWVDYPFAAVKQDDDRANAEAEAEAQATNTEPKKYDSTERFRAADGNRLRRIDKIQQKLTDKLQKEFGKYAKKKDYRGARVKTVKEQLAKEGMLLQVSGKSFSYGNTKVPEDTLIINLTSTFNCPSKLHGECSWGDKCYGTDRYANVEARNLRNQVTLPKLSVKDHLQLLEAYIEGAPIRLRYIRISEVGDFKDQATLEYCDKLAGHFKAKYGIQTVAYTHRNLDYSNIHNIIINGSSYHVKNADRYFMCASRKDFDKLPEGLNLDGENLDITSAEGNPVTASMGHQHIDTTHGTFKCYCDCRQCRFCYQTKEENGEPEGSAVTVINTPH